MWSHTPPGASVGPLEHAHSHNDYERERPLADALAHGFTSVEADVWLIDGALRVAHHRDETEPGRTLRRLYLEPLEDRVDDEGDSVFSRWNGEFQLLVDIKTAASPTYEAVHRALRDYRTMLTRSIHGDQRAGAIQVVISGHRPLHEMLGQDVRFAGYDGRLRDLDNGLPASFMPLVSDDWTEQFDWYGIGPMPSEERRRLHRIVAQAHAAGYRVRFWATPDLAVLASAQEAVWRELIAAGVDEINTDDLSGLESFLQEDDPAEQSESA